MTTNLKRMQRVVMYLGVACLALVAPLSVSAQEINPDDKEIARLVKQLGSDVFKDREAARKRLEEIGEPALDALTKANPSTLEARRRAEAIIVIIENKLYEGRVITDSSERKLCFEDLNASKYERGFYVAYSDKGKLVASAATHLDQMNASIRLLNRETGKEVSTLTHGWSGMPLIFCFTADGKTLASANSVASNQFFVGAVRIWDVETGKELKQIVVPPAHCIAISPDGKRVASGGAYDTGMRVWDIESGKELRKYEGHIQGVHRVTFLPDGKHIASVGGDGTARIWRAAPR